MVEIYGGIIKGIKISLLRYSLSGKFVHSKINETMMLMIKLIRETPSPKMIVLKKMDI